MALTDTYALPRTDSEMDRTEAQGRIWSINLGYHLHPKIEASLTASPRIADVGTATGTYLAELSEELPSAATYDGFDSSEALFRSDLPTSISLHKQDARADFPAHLHGQFDAVHLRLIVGGMDKDDWALATEKLVKLLKPGGALQWEEADFPQAQYLRAGDKHASVSAFKRLLEGIKYGMMHRFLYGFSTLPDIFRQAGLERVETDMVSCDRVPETRRPLAVTAVAGAEAWARKASHWPKDEVDELVKKAVSEVELGAYPRYDIHSIIGFKPKP